MTEPSKPDTIKVNIYFAACLHCTDDRTITVDRKEWEGMTTEERDKLCREKMAESMSAWGYEEQED